MPPCSVCASGRRRGEGPLALFWCLGSAECSSGRPVPRGAGGGGPGECGAAGERFKGSEGRNRMCRGFLRGSRCAHSARRGPLVSFLTEPIGFFENEAKRVESGTALGLRTGCENVLKD